eukprot:1157863-Pelagomonas_calceolata.AAC.2
MSLASHMKQCVPPLLFRFNLALTKAKIMKAMDERTVSNLFKRFYGSDLCDRLLKVRGGWGAAAGSSAQVPCCAC